MESTGWHCKETVQKLNTILEFDEAINKNQLLKSIIHQI